MKHLLRAALLLGSALGASGHFVFIVPQAGGAKADVFLNEVLKPSDEVDVGMLGGANLTVRDVLGRETILTLVRGDRSYVISLPGSGTRLIHGAADLGVMQMGAATKPYLLVYYPRTIVGDPFHSQAVSAEGSPIEIIPLGEPGAMRLKVLAYGNPQAKSEVTIILPDGVQKKLTTDAAGVTDVLTQSGRYGAWARYWEPKRGERGGKPYAETRNYATLVFDVPGGAIAAATGAAIFPAASHFATLPEATSSFGAVVSDGWLYVYGGHTAATHSYSTEAVSGQFARLKLSGSSQWEQLPAGPAMQGMNLAAYEGKIYRIGGMSPRNKPGEPAATFSIADCARFNPATMKWEQLPSLPEPRSSHDFVVIGGKLIVTGGWTLKGPQPTEWLDTVEVLDLAVAHPAWSSLKQPFRRRALIAAAHSGKMYVMGGFDEGSTISQDVDIFDPLTSVWTKGPALPGDDSDGFAPAACEHDGSLYVSVADGALYRLTQSKWEKSGKATPRIAHRIASDGKNILVIGGAGKGKNSDLIEAVAVAK